MACTCTQTRHIEVRHAIIACLIFDNWPFRKTIITGVTVAKSKMVNTEFHLLL